MGVVTRLGAALVLVAALSGAAAAAEEPRSGGTLLFAVSAEPTTYDCHNTQLFAVLHRVAPHYSTLLRYAAGHYPDIVSDLADGWEVSPDQLSYTFRLHPGVKFHDGAILTSEDVKVSYERIANPPPGVISYRRLSLSKVSAIETPDPLTVVFRLKEIDPSIVGRVFASPWNCIYSAARLRQDPTFPDKTVMGTGPFRFVEHVAGSHWVGERFKDYFRAGHPYLDGFRAVTTSDAASANAVAGQQVMAEFRGFSPSERDRIVGKLGKDASVLESPWLLHVDISFNPKRKPFDDARVRRALSLAIDRWGGAGPLSKISVLRHVGGVMMPGGGWAASDAELEQYPGFGRDMAANRAEARRLLKEAGADNLTFSLTNRSLSPYSVFGIYAIDQWRQIGVKVDHQQLETAAWVNAARKETYDAIIDGFTDYTDDPTSSLVKFMSAARWSPSSNTFDDTALNELYDQQARTLDPAERARIVRRFEKLALEQAYTVPGFWWHRIVVMNDRVRGWTMSPSQMLYQNLEDVWLKQP